MECPICGNNFTGSTCNECGYGDESKSDNKVVGLELIDFKVHTEHKEEGFFLKKHTVEMSYKISIQIVTVTGTILPDQVILLYYDGDLLGEVISNKYGIAIFENRCNNEMRFGQFICKTLNSNIRILFKNPDWKNKANPMYSNVRIKQNLE